MSRREQARRLILHRQQEIFWEILRNQKHPERAVISQEKAIPAHRKRAEVPEPSSYRIFRNIPDHRVAVNGNVPYFLESDLTDVSFESYSDLDALGRCGVAYASVSTDTMPTEKRGSIGEVKPTGWHNKKYDFVDGKYVYNRCHLIGYQLTAENANEKNLITGTRYLNVQGMLPFENLAADYVKETGNHVLYRVTPIFEGDNLLASGVLMEADCLCFSGF